MSEFSFKAFSDYEHQLSQPLAGNGSASDGSGPDSERSIGNAVWNSGVAECLTYCAVLAYKSPQAIERICKRAYPRAKFYWFEAHGRSWDTQAFGITLERDTIVAFRGTKELRDFLTDVLARRSRLRGFDTREWIPDAWVHTGFQLALDAIWSEQTPAYDSSDHPSTDGTLVDFLQGLPDDHRLWLTGHSLGGALATVAAARMQLTPAKPGADDLDIEALVTIGSPRVLDESTANALSAKLKENRIFRIYRSLDPVPAVPYRPYKHVSGRRSFITRKGDLRLDISGKVRPLDTLASFFRAAEDAVGSLIPGQHGGFGAFVSDHDSEDYLLAVADYDFEIGRPGVQASDIAAVAAPAGKLAVALGAPIAALTAWINGRFCLDLHWIVVVIVVVGVAVLVAVAFHFLYRKRLTKPLSVARDERLFGPIAARSDPV